MTQIRSAWKLSFHSCAVAFVKRFVGFGLDHSRKAARNQLPCEQFYSQQKQERLASIISKPAFWSIRASLKILWHESFQLQKPRTKWLFWWSLEEVILPGRDADEGCLLEFFLSCVMNAYPGKLRQRGVKGFKHASKNRGWFEWSHRGPVPSV